MDTLFSILHVVAAVFIVGPMAILPMSALRSIRTGHSDQAAALARTTRLFSLLSLVVVVLGFGLMAMADPRYHLSITTPWILTSLVLYAAALVVSLAVVVPSLRKAGRSGAQPFYGRIAGGSGVVTLLLLGVTTMMVWKP